MAAPTLSALRTEYEVLFESCLIRPERAAPVNEVATKVRANRARYATVGEPLGVPWYVIGAIHALESSLNFSTHLHNGDPLTARTTHVPAGRPASGSPPFTWEESAIDALQGRGLQKVTDWSMPGVLFVLEGYNGWGYRQNHPEVKSPYLWSFSNHYKSGKYVADGKFSATAVSQQCGAAVILERLAQMGSLQLPPSGPRQLHLTNPYMTGPDVEEAQTLLAKNPFGNFLPGEVDGEYGPITADAVYRAKVALGYPDSQVNHSFGALLKSYLDGSKALPAAFLQLRKKRLAAAPVEDRIRKAIVDLALWGVQNSGQIAYTEGRIRLAALNSPPKTLPLATDCSAFATLCYCWAGAPNPNFDGPYDLAEGGYTGTMLRHCKQVSQSAAKPGDLVVWTPPSDGAHVAILVTTGANPWLVSHGGDHGPLRIRFSDEDAWQRAHGHGTPVYLSVF